MATLRAQFERTIRRPSYILGGILFYIALVQILRYLSFGVAFEDANYVYPPLFFPFGSPPLQCDVCLGGSYLGEHQAYSLFLGRIWTLLFPLPYLVPLLTPFLVGISFASFVRSVKDSIAPAMVSFLLACWFAFHDFHSGLTFDLREDVLGFAFFFMAILGAREGNAIKVLVFGSMGALSKETGAAIFPIWAGTLFFSEAGKKIRLSRRILILIVSLLIFGFCFFYGIPKWNDGGGSSMIAQRLGFEGRSGHEILIHLFMHPQSLLSSLGFDSLPALWDRAKYLLLVLLPLAPFFWRSLNATYIPGFVVVAGNFASISPLQRSFTFHYGLFAAPFLFLGMLQSYETLSRRGAWTRSRTMAALAFGLAFTGGWPSLTRLIRDVRLDDVIFIREEIGKVPENAIIAGDARTLPHFVDHRFERVFPAGGRSNRPVTEAHLAILNRVVFEEQSAEVKSSWHRNRCSPPETVCVYSFAGTDPEKE